MIEFVGAAGSGFSAYITQSSTLYRRNNRGVIGNDGPFLTENEHGGE